MKKFCWISLSIMCVLSSTITANEIKVNQINEYKMSDQDRNVLEAINHLDKACLLAQSIEDVDTQESIVSQLRKCMKCLKREYFSKNYDNIMETSSTLYENLGEILADCQDIQLREDITCCVDDMMNALDR